MNTTKKESASAGIPQKKSIHPLENITILWKFKGIFIKPCSRLQKCTLIFPTKKRMQPKCSQTLHSFCFLTLPLAFRSAQIRIRTPTGLHPSRNDQDQISSLCYPRFPKIHQFHCNLRLDMYHIQMWHYILCNLMDTRPLQYIHLL